MAVVWVRETSLIYTEGSRTLVLTDYSPLLWLRNNVRKFGRLTRWVLRVHNFTFDFQHKPAAGNRIADALWRNPVEQQETSTQSSKKELLAAFVGEREKCQSCCKRALSSLTRGGKGDKVTSSSQQAVRERAKATVQLERQLPDRESRRINETDTR